MSVDMTTQSIAVGDNWVKVGNDYIGSSPNGSSATGTITGTGFGTKNGTAYFDDFEDRSVGAAGGTIGDLVVSNNAGTSIVNTDSVSGSKALSQDFSVEDFPKIYKALSGAQSRFYMSCYIKWSGTVTGSTVWKFGRIGAGTAYSGNPKAGDSYTSTDVNYPSGFGGEIVSSNGIVGYGANRSTAGTPSALYTPDTWHFFELEFYTGTVDGNDSYFVTRVDGDIATEWDGIEFLTTANSALPDWFMTPINGLDNGPDITMLMDSIYIDESRARVVMTDNATYASSTKYAVQPITAYSDTSVSYTKNKGSFIVGSTAYLHLFNDVGTPVYSSGAITVTEDNV